MKILICGGRTFGWILNDRGYKILNPKEVKLFNSTLDQYYDFGKVRLVSGGAAGADTLAEFWAKARQVPIYIFHAPWIRHPKAGGPIRNKMMLDEARPDLVLAFPGGRGTDDMCKQSYKAGIEVIKIKGIGDSLLRKANVSR